MKELPKQPTSATAVRINLLSCDGCGACAAICPNNVLVLRDMPDDEIAALSLLGKLFVRVKGRTKSYADNPAACTACRRCEKRCHEHAIRVETKNQVINN
jgi:2-oxoglutarate ferredoxin oxidoreductase subunit delta